ncbi:hypothetical protein F909_03315 [Acinetobacter sp. ANC 3929]|nr:hypothetical protein F909_03315 [Acinetobacter sp. ANC 3929]
MLVYFLELKYKNNQYLTFFVSFLIWFYNMILILSFI